MMNEKCCKLMPLCRRTVHLERQHDWQLRRDEGTLGNGFNHCFKSLDGTKCTSVSNDRPPVPIPTVDLNLTATLQQLTSIGIG
mmetsp:Transcript_41988/g.96226  ORF Transcript_41988/g.96226 Transcript_41988/m.96226 type:complete len:83 (-) Transcript_41988:972-1220(-)